MKCNFLLHLKGFIFLLDKTSHASTNSFLALDRLETVTPKAGRNWDLFGNFVELKIEFSGVKFVSQKHNHAFKTIL
jgi:hypothetical protein